MQSKKSRKIYVGSTSKEPEIRVKDHNHDSNKWSRNNKPFTLKYYEKYSCKEDALKREKFYKMGFGKQIKYIIVDLLDKRGVVI